MADYSNRKILGVSIAHIAAAGDGATAKVTLQLVGKEPDPEGPRVTIELGVAGVRTLPLPEIEREFLDAALAVLARLGEESAEVLYAHWENPPGDNLWD